MRVDAINHVSQLYQSTKVKSVDKTKKSSYQDAYETSQSAKDYQVAKNAIAESSNVREDRVAEMKEALASGTYNVSSQEIAEKMISNYYDISI